MKKFLFYLFAIAITGLAFTSCNNDEDPFISYSDDISGVYFVNYGGSSVGPSTITKYNFDKDSVINYYYEAQNNVAMTSNVQYGCLYEDKIYLMGNGEDQVIVLDSAFVQSIDGISDDIATPRYCVGDGDYLYISCWGSNPDWYYLAGSYIAKFNITTNKVEKTIALPGGPEGLEIANGNLYAALNFKDSVAVIDLDDNSISYIATPAVASYFIKDNSDNLYVSLVSTYTFTSNEDGLGYINTSSNSLEKVYSLSGISSNYASILSANEDISTIYVLATSYDESWNLVGAVYTFDVASGEFTLLIEDLSGTNGLAYNTETEDLYVFGGESYSEPGTVDLYNTDGTYVSQFDCGISPYWAIFLY